MIREILCSEGVPRTAHAHRSNVTDTFSEPPAAGWWYLGTFSDNFELPFLTGSTLCVMDQ